MIKWQSNNTALVELGFNNDSSPQKFLADGSELLYFNSSNGADEKELVI